MQKTTNPVTSHEWGKDRITITTNGTYPHRCSVMVNQIMVATVKVMSAA